ncbi:MAG: cupin domain-containing protein [Candidatus Hermodarchaeota archaeon]
MKMKKKIPTEEELAKFNVNSWGTWSKEVSEFDWSYGDTETCYILDGEVEVTDSETGEKIEFKKGDLVQFEKGLKCVWNVKRPIRKYYSFDLDYGEID